MSKIKVDEISNTMDNGPVYFPYGVTGDASRMTLKPGIVSFAPNQLETNVGLTSSIQIGFNQTMQFLGVGTITIREGSATGTIHESFTCGVSAGATITNNLLTINPTIDFEVNQTYFVTLPNTGIANTIGATIDEVTNYQFATIPNNFSASGGDTEFLLYDTNSPTNYYKYHIFANPGILTTSAPSSQALEMSVLMVGGGGAGGGAVDPSSPSYAQYSTGGGGAGGLLQFTGPTLNIGTGNHEIYVGAGGTAPQYIAGPNQIPYPGRRGSDTILISPTVTHTALGGGWGGSVRDWNNPNQALIDLGFPGPDASDWGAPGGSGGGGGGRNPSPSTWSPGGLGTPGQGNNGAKQWGSLYNPTGTGPAGPTANESICGGGGGGAGGNGQQGQGYYYPAANRPNFTARHGKGGDGLQVPAFPSAVLAPRFNPGDPSTYSRMGPTGTYYAGGGAGGGAPTNPSGYGTLSNIGGYGGGGQSSIPWRSDYSSLGTPTLPQPSFTQNGSALLGGGGGGGSNHPNPGSESNLNPQRAGNGGPGCFMIRYVYFSS